MDKDTGKLKKVDGTWYVYPDNMPIRFIQLCEEDVRAIDNGYCLTRPNTLTVEFELIYQGKKNYAGQMDYNQYARIT